MATQQLERGRLIDHIQLVVKDLAASRRFYEAVHHGEAKRSAASVTISF